ncbi:hypothetical protein FACS189479_02900 [Spirochaetia bacterium]|nr:hypothetical protein FACS189479_02900 [Spirochaetia bacterium]
MKKTQEELEKIINASLLFSIDREKDGALWQSEKMKMFEAAYWLSAYLRNASTVSHEGPKRARNIKYGDIACKCVRDCIDKYNPELGKPFLNYFKAALRNEINNDPHHNFEENPGGVLIPHESDIRRVMAVQKILMKSGKYKDEASAIQFIADETGLSVNQVKKYINESLLLDAKPLPSDEKDDSAHETGDEFRRDKIILVLDIIQRTFSSEKFWSSSKLTLAKALLTNWQAPFLISHSLEQKDITKYTFVDNSTLEEYRKTEEIKDDAELAEKFGYKGGSIASKILRKYKEAVEIFKN